MNPNQSFLKLGLTSLALGVVLLLAQWKCAGSPAQLQEQQQSQSQPPPPSPTPSPSSQPASDPAPPLGPLPVKRRKVWTNDDVVVLRTPTDNYLAEKAAKQAADAEAAAKKASAKAAAKYEKEPQLDIKLPDTPEVTEKMVKDTQAEIQEETDVLAKLQKELLDAPAEQQAQMQKEIDHLTEVLETSHRDLKALQEHLQSLREKSQKETSPLPSPPPPTL